MTLTLIFLLLFQMNVFIIIFLYFIKLFIFVI